MNFEKNKRELRKRFQRAYYEKHDYDEYEFWTSGFVVQRDEVHEIVHGSRKTYEDWNMISLTRENHAKAHAGIISKESLFAVKVKSGFTLPEHILIEFDLLEVLKWKEK